MALTSKEARSLRKNDNVYSHYVRSNGQPGVTTWRVFYNRVSANPQEKHVVDVALVTGTTSGKLTNKNLTQFYKTYGEARDAKE